MMRPKSIPAAVALVTMASMANSAHAGLMNGVWDGWTQFQNGPGTDGNGPNEDGNIGPGVGGQAFDAEYLLYRINGGSLFLGLQTGFDVVDGHQRYGSGNNNHYYAGDMALSFNGVVLGSPATYEYAIDFGLATAMGLAQLQTPVEVNGDGEAGDDLDGRDPAGLYSVSTWHKSNYIQHAISDPFAMDQGVKLLDLLSNVAGSGSSGGQTSYYRQVELNIAGLRSLPGFSGSSIDAHWTMSCGNDNINGTFTLPDPRRRRFTVPEPGALTLLALGVGGLLAVRPARRPKA